jgi:hypothetical protein
MQVPAGLLDELSQAAATRTLVGPGGCSSGVAVRPCAARRAHRSLRRPRRHLTLRRRTPHASARIPAPRRVGQCGPFSRCRP